MNRLTIVIAVIITLFVTGFGYPAKASAEKKIKLKKQCIMGSCWRDIDVMEMGEIGCPAPGLIFSNVYKELNGYHSMATYLGLSKKQLDKLDKIRKDFRKLLYRKRAQMRLFSLDLIGIMSEPDVDTGRSRDTVTGLRSTCQEVITGAIDAVIEARGLLTQEQKLKAKGYTGK